MIDRLFLAALTFSMLAGGPLAFGSEMFSARPATVVARAPQIITLPLVEVTGQRTLPRSARLAQAASDTATRAQ